MMTTDIVVVDTNSIIKGELGLSSLNLKTKYTTVPEVLSIEIRDESTRVKSQSLLNHIEVNSPDSESLKFVTDFSKATGDYASLSVTDIRIIALTLMLEKERVGNIDHLRRHPLPIRTMTCGPSKSDTKTHSEEQITGTEKLQSPITEEVQDREPLDDQDENGWITPQNIKSIMTPSISFIGDESKRKEVSNQKIPVACMTSDYAMQNVIVQIGLNLVSSSGGRISHVRHWILRCHACYRLEHDASKRFCQGCGNPTLTKVSYSIDAETGEIVLYLKKNFQYNLRGTVYSIPKPKGGKGSKDLILREDQKEYQRGLKSYERTKRIMNNDPDALPSLLMSASLRESTSHHLMLHLPVIGHGRKNINQVKK